MIVAYQCKAQKAVKAIIAVKCWQVPLQMVIKWISTYLFWLVYLEFTYSLVANILLPYFVAFLSTEAVPTQKMVQAPKLVQKASIQVSVN